jgi:hypothetical protein
MPFAIGTTAKYVLSKNGSARERERNKERKEFKIGISMLILRGGCYI